MARSRQSEQKSQVRQALRSVRKVYRQLDTRGEKFERRVDRLIERKTQVYPDEIVPLVSDYRQIQQQMAVLEKSLADAVNIAAY